MNKSEQTFEFLPEDYEKKVLEKKRQFSRKKRKRNENFNDLNINSLMDILTILLVFLLKSYSTDPLTIEPSADIMIPASTSSQKPKAAVSITVSKSAILVDNKPIIALKDGKIESSHKRGGEDGYFIMPLSRELTNAAKQQRRLNIVNPSIKFEGLLTIVMDEQTPYRLLSEVIYTAGQAEFSKFKFATISKN